MNSTQKQSILFIGIGTHWKIDIWDEISQDIFAYHSDTIQNIVSDFENTYSRFKEDSLLCKLSNTTGVFNVSEECVELLLLYKKYYVLSSGLCTPLIGQHLSEAGYDKDYSFKSRDLSPLPNFTDAIRIFDDNHIEITISVMIDFGGLGKGYLVDKVSDYLKVQKVKKFCVNAGGDMYYATDDEEMLRVGLEHPQDATKVIGVVEIRNESICGSSGNRRNWGSFHHIINPAIKESPHNIFATWVRAKKTVDADALNKCLYLGVAIPDDIECEYLVFDKQKGILTSKNFTGEVYE
ncbi:MAG: FAD:protein FMN transferase [Candidatus Roizmanbacteria bacterium]